MHMISFPTKYSFHRLPHGADDCLSAVPNWNNNKKIISLFRKIWIKWLAINATKRRYNLNLQRRDRPQITAYPYEIIDAWPSLTFSSQIQSSFLGTCNYGLRPRLWARLSNWDCQYCPCLYHTRDAQVLFIFIKTLGLGRRLIHFH